MRDALVVSGVWKRYRLRVRTLGQLAADLWPWHRYDLPSRRKAFWALEDVSIRVEPGTALGLIGANGSGKSTMLKLIAGMMQPTRGTITVSGRLALLAYLGAGFHGDLTGRENVFLQGAILGLKGRELRAKLDVIFAFAELQQFIDVPVKFYSSGMSLRLGFAIAAHVDPEILLIDEAFAVGDTAFRDRCLKRILGFKAAGVTMMLVSHERYLVEQLCDQAVLLHHGQVMAAGKPAEAFEAYEQLIATEAGVAAAASEGDVDRCPLEIEGVELVCRDSGGGGGGGGGATPLRTVDEPLTVRIRLRATRDVEGAAVGVQIAQGARVLHGTRSNRQGVEITARAGERATIELQYQGLNLIRGAYALHVSVLEHRLAQAPALELRNAARFSVTHGETEGVGLVRLPHTWRRVEG